MKLSENGIKFLEREEGLRLKAYQDQVNVWTIGYGNTFYENGVKVKKGDVITKERAKELKANVGSQFEDAVNSKITSNINQSQYDALVSLAYNIGVGGFKGSLIARKVNASPNDVTIRQAFQSWRYGTINGKKEPILLGRRKREADLYFSIVTPRGFKRATTGLNIRINPTVHMSVIKTLEKGTLLEVLWEDRGWAEVFVDGLKGWVSSAYIK